jgi:hypothetical protein
VPVLVLLLVVLLPLQLLLGAISLLRRRLLCRRCQRLDGVHLRRWQR